jgi:hypothetical protein
MNLRLYLLPLLAKGFTVDFFVLLPVLYARKIISSVQVGYFGALSIAMLVVGALLISKWLHRKASRDVLLLGSGLAVLATSLFGAGILIGSTWLILLRTF